MVFSKLDIRIIKGDVVATTEKIREFLTRSRYKVVSVSYNSFESNIKAENSQQSFLKLYFSNSPQIVDFRIDRRSKDKIEISTKTDLFFKFRLIYYAVIGIFLSGSFLFFTATSGVRYESVNTLLERLRYTAFSEFNILIALSFLLAAFVFFLRTINLGPYEAFLIRLYDYLGRTLSEKKNIIHNRLIFPDLFTVSFCFIFFFILTFLLSEKNTFNLAFTQYLFLGAATISGIALIMLVLIMINREAIATRVSFIIIGIGLCVPIAIYCSAPVSLSFSGDIRQEFERRLNIDNPDELQKYSNYNQNASKKVAAFYLTACSILFFIFSVLLINVAVIPIRFVRELNQFYTTQKKSVYYKALHPNSRSIAFNLVVSGFWLVVSIVNITGVYFSFSILEKTIFSKNLLFESEFADLFYKNLQVSMIVLFQTKWSSEVILNIHNILMVFLSLPMIGIFLLIIWKNLKRTYYWYALIKKQMDKNAAIKAFFEKKSKRICDSAGIQMPIVRITDSLDIRSETIFTGFPFFKNVALFSTGAWNELKDEEEELEILIAHEIWHIKKHTLPRRVLCFLSDYSLFGNGFLALLQNSFQIEKEADAFAINWVLKKTDREFAVFHLKSLLERIEEVNWVNSVIRPGESFNFAMFKNMSDRNDFLNLFNEASWFGKIKINLSLLFQIYFGNEIQSYFHPSLNQRIDWAKGGA